MTIIKIEIKVEEVVAVHHEIPRINHHQNQTLLQGRINNVTIMIIEIRMVVQKLRKMEIKMPLPRIKKIKNQKMTVPREEVVMIVRLRQDGIEIRIRHQDGVTETSITAAVAVDDEETEIGHEVDHAVVNGIDPTVVNGIDRVGQTGTVDDRIVHIEIITGQDLDHVKGQGREVEEEEVTIIIIEGLPDQTGIDDHTVGQGHVNVDLEVERRSRLIIEAVAVAVGGEIDQDQ